MLKAKKANIALAAWENGYFPDKMERPDIDELKTAIRDELFGEKKYAFQQGKESVIKDIEELEAALDMLDIDYSNMSASELEAVYNEAVNEYNASNKVTFDEDEYIDDEDYIPFQQSMDIAEQIDKDKYLNNTQQTPLQNLYDIHKNIAESVPEKYTGSREKEDVLKYLGSKDGQTAKIKTPIESVVFNKNIIHLLEENNSERLEDLNSVVRTLKNPSLIVANNENGSEYHYYIKVFRKNDKSIGHLQIVKYKDDGSFYVTNHRLKNKKFTNIINSGHIILDASTPTAMKETLSSVNTIISQSDSGVKTQFQKSQDPFGAYKDNIIYLFQKANASTFMHETAHWFKKELKKFGSEKSAMMLKKVEEWENSELARQYTVDFKDGYFVVKNNKKTPRDRYGDFLTHAVNIPNLRFSTLQR